MTKATRKDARRQTLHLPDKQQAEPEQNADAPAPEAEQPAAEAPAPTPTNMRQALMDEIARKTREERQERLGEPEPEPAAEPEAEAEAEPEAEPEPEPEPEPEAERQPEPDDEMVTIKVDGVEQQVPASRVREIGIRAMQKELAADARLNEASQRQKQIEEQQAALRKREMEIEKVANDLQQRYNHNNAGPSKDAQDFKETAKSVLKAIYDDDQDNAADALAQLFQGRQQATPDLQTVVRQAEKAARDAARQEYAERKAREDHAKAVEAFKKTFPDVASDPRLFDEADRETLKVKQEHPDWELPQILEEAGKRVVKWKRQFGGSQVTQTATARKQSLDNPQAANVRHAPPPAQKPKTASEKIADMRRARGLPV